MYPPFLPLLAAKWVFISDSLVNFLNHFSFPCLKIVYVCICCQDKFVYLLEIRRPEGKTILFVLTFLTMLIYVYERYIG